MSKCNHWVGIIPDVDYEIPLYFNNISEVLHKQSDDNNRLCLPPYASLFPNRKRINPVDYLDRRRGLCTMFYYCPNCGEKISWSKIKEKTKQEGER